MEINRENLLNLIRTELAARKLSISALERQASVAKDTIRDFLRGKTQVLRADKLQKILRILHPEEKIAISGSMGKEAEITSIASDIQDKIDCPPGFSSHDLKAVRVDGDAMLPVFQNGWIICYSTKTGDHNTGPGAGWQVPYNQPVSGEAFAEFVGKPCVAKLADGRLFLRTLKYGSAPGKYNLIGYNNVSDIQDAAIEWIGKIVFIRT